MKITLHFKKQISYHNLVRCLHHFANLIEYWGEKYKDKTNTISSTEHASFTFTMEE